MVDEWWINGGLMGCISGKHVIGEFAFLAGSVSIYFCTVHPSLNDNPKLPRCFWFMQIETTVFTNMHKKNIEMQ